MYPFRQANVPPGVHAPQVGNPCTILLCLFTSKDDINGSRLNYSTVPSNIRLGICSIYKTSLLHRPVTILVSHQAAPPHILQQNCVHGYMYLRLGTSGLQEYCLKIVVSPINNTQFSMLSFYLMLIYRYVF